MAYDSYTLLHVQQDGPLVTATINNPPINLITMALFGELAQLGVGAVHILGKCRMETGGEFLPGRRVDCCNCRAARSSATCTDDR